MYSRKKLIYQLKFANIFLRVLFDFKNIHLGDFSPNR
jgi:hypothetical protein